MESFSDEKREFSALIERLTKERHSFQKHIDRMYIDKLDGEISQGFYDRKRFEWREQLEKCLENIEQL